MTRTLPRSARALAVIGAAALTLGLAACGSDGAAENVSESPQTTETGTTAPDAPAGEAVEAEDGSFSVVLPEGYTVEPVDQAAAAEAQLPPGSEMLLQATKGDPAAVEAGGDFAAIMVGKVAQQDLRTQMDQLQQGYAQLTDMQIEGMKIEAGEPVETTVDGEPAMSLRATTSVADDGSGQAAEVVVDALFVNHGDSSYIVTYTTPAEQAAPTQLEDFLQGWRWAS